MEDPGSGSGRPRVYFGFDAGHVDRTFAHSLPQNPLFAIRDRMGPGLVVTNGMAVPEPQFRHSAFYDGWAGPRGLCSPVTVVLHRGGSSYAPLTLVRPDRASDVSEQHCTLLRRIAPHLVRAFRTGLRLERLGGRSQALGALLSRLDVAAFLVDGGLRVAHANPAAERLIASPPAALFVKRGALCASDRQANHTLQAAVLRASARAGPGETIPIPGEDPRDAVPVHVLPVPRAADGLFPRADVLVAATPFQGDHRSASPPPLADLFGPTPSEARLAAALASGQSLKSAVAAQGIRFGTARSDLRGSSARPTPTARASWSPCPRACLLCNPSPERQESVSRASPRPPPSGRRRRSGRPPPGGRSGPPRRRGRPPC